MPDVTAEITRADDARVAYPLFQVDNGGSTPTSALRARNLVFQECPKLHAVCLVRRWHSRLPRCQVGPWRFAFSGVYEGRTYVVALWNNPSARCLPSQWLELRRMAASPDAPRNTCSRFLMWMVRWFSRNCPEAERCISYQDMQIHKGTIYRAAGWTQTVQTVARVRDRTRPRRGTSRAYRSNLNGMEADAVSKLRWEYELRKYVAGG